MRAGQCAAGFFSSLVLVFGLSLNGACAAGGDAGLFDSKSGLRIARYRAPVPEAVDGAQRIFVEELQRLVKEKDAVVVDVAPAEDGFIDPHSGAWVGYKPRQHIPGSVWLPEVGRGDADGDMVAYFRDNLERLTKGDKRHPVIIYCYADCWMSWNAVKRAASFGYSALFWFPEGTDGWRDWDMPFESAVPVSVR